jgi:abortive infection bacteriophage resistance protein
MEEKINQQIIYIKSKWFIISDLEKTKWYLEKVWINRLKRYFNTVNTYEWTDFQEIINAYIFDKSIRNINLIVLESIEKSFKNIFIIKILNIINEDIYQNVFLKDRIDYLNKKLLKLWYCDDEIKRHIDRKVEQNSLLIDKLNFGEMIKCYLDLKTEYKLLFSKYYWINLNILNSWLDWLLYLRNVSSHWWNVFNKKMVISIKWREISKQLNINENNQYSSIFIVLCVFKKILIPNYQWENKVINKINYYNISLDIIWLSEVKNKIIINKKRSVLKKLFSSKEIFPSEHIDIEAWKILVNTVYTKYVKKSN